MTTKKAHSSSVLSMIKALHASEFHTLLEPPTQLLLHCLNTFTRDTMCFEEIAQKIRDKWRWPDFGELNIQWARVDKKYTFTYVFPSLLVKSFVVAVPFYSLFASDTIPQLCFFFLFHSRALFLLIDDHMAWHPILHTTILCHLSFPQHSEINVCAGDIPCWTKAPVKFNRGHVR